MTDRYQALRDAIATGPTPGPWYSMTTVRYNGYSIRHRTGDPKRPMVPIAVVNRRHAASDANRDLIGAADPDTIRALLQERDALREALQIALGDVQRGPVPLTREEKIQIMRAALAAGSQP